MESPKLNLLIDKHVLKWLDNLRWTWPSVCVCVCVFFGNEFFDVAKEGDHPSIGRFIKGENHPYDDELGQIWRLLTRYKIHNLKHPSIFLATYWNQI